MHDSIIANSILKDLEQYENVREVSLKVGELFGIEPDHLIGHLKEVSDIKFNAVQVVSKVKCKCGYTGRAKIVERFHDFVLFECPECEETPEVVKGDKIIIGDVLSD